MWPPLCPGGLSLASAPGPGLGRQMAARSLFRRSICCRRAASRSSGSGVLWGYLQWTSWQKRSPRNLHIWSSYTVISNSFVSFVVCKRFKHHLCPVWLAVSVSSVTPAVEKEVDSSSVPIFLSWANGLSGSRMSPTGSDDGKKREPNCVWCLKAVYCTCECVSALWCEQY